MIVIYVGAELVNGRIALVGREDGVDEIDRVERFGRERVASSVLSSSFSVLMWLRGRHFVREKRNEMYVYFSTTVYM